MDNDTIKHYLSTIDNVHREADLRHNGLTVLTLMELERQGYTYSRLHKKGRHVIVRHYVSKRGYELLNDVRKDK